MNRSIPLFVAAMLLVPIDAAAVDGVVLLTQSTVLAAGGFPYHVNQAGSYRLAGSLVAPLDQPALIINASNVAIDLNGFAIQCSVDIARLNATGPEFACISEGATLHNVALRNGSINVLESDAATTHLTGYVAASLPSSDRITLEDLRIDAPGGNGVIAISIDAGPRSIIRHNIFSGNPFSGGPRWNCPSLLEGNVNAQGGQAPGGPGCVLVNNVNLF